MHLMEKDATPKFGPIQVDITEDANLIQTETRKTNIRSIDFKLYRQQVQGRWSRCSSKTRF